MTLTILQFVKAADWYLNVSIAYRILLTVPVTVASAERKRLNGLAMCSIEKDVLDDINLDTVIEDFASRNARRQFFIKY
uniref:HAT C-terminal dimerisation domain-containing protein n=1 Tax=Setaria viridis TaxID=4556 RepID=A0A4U6VHQ8_SETVI|nr:hypothetical protein SEVIR_3G296400v2 [Setaria viridis]